MVVEIPYFPNSLALFSKIADKPWSVLLDSCHDSYRSQSRFDIIATDPRITLQTLNGVTTIHSKSNEPIISRENPFEILKKYLPSITIDNKFIDLPFIGGAIGFWGYDLIRNTEKIAEIANNDCQLPEMALGIYDSAVIIDHHNKKSYFINFDNTQTIENFFAAKSAQTPTTFKLLETFQANMNKEYYRAAFQKIKEYIYAGDCYQVNFSQRFEALFSGSLWEAYCKLRQKNPAPYAAYLQLPATTILSLSPEQFLIHDRNQVSTKPIKGTRPYYPHNIEIDAKMQQELLASQKDQAENLMIVDLMRNDLGKICSYGSIKVPKLFALETFANVHHLVSTITGKLESDKTCIDLLKACFPGGSITGAPKIRAMEIIEEVEPHRRAIYCGAIGYISNHGRMDTNIAIRTCYTHANKIYCSAGSGLVAESEEENEYQETLTKIDVILKTLEG